MFQIEKNIPQPPSRREKRKAIYTSMEVGDSFSFPKDKLIAVRSSCNYYKVRTGFSFSIRSFPDGTCRIWRIK